MTIKLQGKYLVFALLVTIFLYGCNSQINPDSGLPLISPAATTNKTLFWMEYEGLFYTLDLARAQKEIPFKIILPTYFPEDSRKKIPDIKGPLSQFQKDDKIEVEIKYHLYPGYKSGLIIISETNYEFALGGLELNPELERIEIEGLSVVKTKDDWSPNIAYYSFNSKNICYYIEAHYLPNEESNKMVESMIMQLK
ncbi:hypothetical protein ACFLVB_03040 [Chloroflexota bacterium]